MPRRCAHRNDMANRKALLIPAELNRDTQNQIRRIYSHELPLVHTNEMTPDYCFFCHDKKHFFVVKGHFCSFLVSNIYWLTSLSTDYERSMIHYFHSTSQIFLSFFFSLKREALICGNYFLIILLRFRLQFSPSFFLFFFNFCTCSAFQNSMFALDDPWVFDRSPSRFDDSFG